MPTPAFASPIRSALQISGAALTALLCTAGCSDTADNGGQQTTSAGIMDISGLLDSGGLDTAAVDTSKNNDTDPPPELPGLDVQGNGSDSGVGDTNSQDADGGAKAGLELLYDAALITGGFPVESPKDFAGRIYAMVGAAVGGGEKKEE